MRRAAPTRTLALTVLAGSLGMLSLTTAFPVPSAHAAARARASPQDGALSWSDRLDRIDELVQSGDCSTARSEIRSLLSENPETLLGSDATLAQIREFQNRVDATLDRASRSC